jgi:hypothetical protein
MKRLCLIVLLAAGSMVAQDQAAPAQPQAPKTPKFQTNLVEKTIAPTFSDINCSGFMTKENIEAKNLVIGGEFSPHVSQFGGRDTIFLSGEGLTVGSQFRLVRRVADKNRMESFPGQYKMAKGGGDQWADLGYAHVVQVVDGTPLALVDFSCQPIVVGDIAVPFTERPPVPYSKSPLGFQEFGVPQSSTTGMIVQAKDFDFLLGTGKKVYINLGTEKGLKPGDYLRVTRGYDWKKDVRPIDRQSTYATMSEETSDRMPKVPKGQESKFPRRGLGEMIVLWVSPNTAVAMVTASREDIQIGDQVELESAPPVQQAQQ